MNEGYIDVINAISFLNHLGAVGVPFDQEDDNECYPFNYYLSGLRFDPRSEFSNRLELLLCIIRRAGKWKVVETEKFYSMNLMPYKLASALLSIEEANKCFEEDDRRSVPSSVVRRDLVEWTSTLKIHHDLTLNEDLIGSLLGWTDGLQVFLSLRLKINPKLEARTLELAIRGHKPKAIALLVQSGFKIDNNIWKLLCDEVLCLDSFTERTIFSVVLESMNLLQPERTLTDSCTRSVCRVSEDEKFQPYTYPLVPLKAMQCAWDAGYRNVDDTWRRETPLWRLLAAYLFDMNYTYFSFSILVKVYWFIVHGAQLDWIHPTYGATPAHLIAKVAFNFEKPSQYRYLDIREEIVLKSLRLDIQDNCNCQCSIRGCYAFECAVLSALRDKKTHVSCKLLRKLIAFADNEQSCRSWMISALIRAITFEELGLTHTCCSRPSDDDLLDYPNRRYRPSEYDEQDHRKYIDYRCRHLPSDEIRDQHHIESEDIALLEVLMGEFSESWSTFNGSLQQYIDTTWTDRMDEERPMDSGIGEQIKDTIEQLGVQLSESLSDDEDLDSDYEDKDFESDSYDNQLRYWRLVEQYPRSVRLILIDYNNYNRFRRRRTS